MKKQIVLILLSLFALPAFSQEYGRPHEDRNDKNFCIEAVRNHYSVGQLKELGCFASPVQRPPGRPVRPCPPTQRTYSCSYTAEFIYTNSSDRSMDFSSQGDLNNIQARSPEEAESFAIRVLNENLHTSTGPFDYTLSYRDVRCY